MKIDQGTPSIENTSTREMDTEATIEILENLGVSPEGIARTSVVIDGSDRPLQKSGIRGSANWKRLDRHSRDEQAINAGGGSIVRIYENYRSPRTLFRQIQRTPEQLNTTLVHELEHVAQMERKDPKFYLGQVMIAGMAALGLIRGERLGKKYGNVARVGGAVIGTAVGMRVGYKLSPHEVQARHRARKVKTTAIS